MKLLVTGGGIWGLIKSYLSNRKHFVLTNIQKASLQSSLLCPLPFLLFINYLPKMKQKVGIDGYANDFKAIVTSKNDMNRTSETIQTRFETN